MNVRPAPGPDGKSGGSFQFFGRPNSYIEFPNRGKIDTKGSTTLLAWVYHEGRGGPIFNYKRNGWGVHFWMISSRTIFVSFMRRTLTATKTLSSKAVAPMRWQFVGATYDRKTGIAKLFVNSRFTAMTYIGRFRLATNYPARMGARIGDGRYFRGRISCMQIYTKALTARQILRRKKRCLRKGTFALGVSEKMKFDVNEALVNIVFTDLQMKYEYNYEYELSLLSLRSRFES